MMNLRHTKTHFLISNLLFVIITLIGILLRLYFINIKDIYTDEVFYFESSIKNSLADILLINGWIKDHGILFFLVVKFFSLFTNDIFLLRLVNIPLYIFSIISIYHIFKTIHLEKGVLIGIVLFTFTRYFVDLSASLSPYNLTILLFLLSLLSLTKLAFHRSKIDVFLGFQFVFTTTLGFYSDYSFLFGYIYYIAIFPLVNSYNRIRVVWLYFIVFIAILPGLFLFISNFFFIQKLFNYMDVYKFDAPSIYDAILYVLRVVFYRFNSALNIMYFFVFIGLFLYINQQLKNKKIFLYSSIFLLAFISHICIIYLLNNADILPLFIERSFWYLYIPILLLSSTIFGVTHLVFKKPTMSIVILVFILVTQVSHYSPVHFQNIKASISEVPINYFSFLEDLSNNKVQRKNSLHIYDSYKLSYPLTNYYLSQSIIHTKNVEQLEIFNSKYKVTELKELNESCKSSAHADIIVYFGFDPEEFFQPRFECFKFKKLFYLKHDVHFTSVFIREYTF